MPEKTKPEKLEAEQIRIMVQGEAKVATKEDPKDIKTFGQE
jgi:hypothetical protein